MFVGRPTELERVDELLEAAISGHGGLLRLTGDPGVGKSALLAVAARRARRRGLQTASVRAVPGAADPFDLVDDLLRALGTPPPAAAPRADVAGATTTLTAALSAWVSARPSLITIDDLPAADVGPVTAVVAAVDRCVGLPLVVLTTGTRAGGRNGGGGAGYQRWPSLRLEPLSPSAAAAVARAALGPAAADRTVAALVAARHGNPAAIVDTAALLTPEEVDGSRPLPDPLPMSPALCASWTAAVEELPGPTREALRVLGVVAPTDLDLLATVLAEVGCRTDELDRADDAGLLRHDDRGVPVLADALLRDAIVASCPSARRRALHRVAARAASQLCLAPAIVVDHLVAAAELPDAELADALAAQAARARQEGDPQGAARAQFWAARLTPGVDARRPRVIRAVQDRLECVNDPAEVLPLLDLVGDGPAPDEPDLTAWVTWLRATVEPDLAVASATEALAVAEARRHSPGLLPGLLGAAADTAWAMGDPRAAMEAIEELERATRAGVRSQGHEPPWLIDALKAAGLFQLGAVAESVPLRARALLEADRLDLATCDVDTLMSAVQLDDLLLADSPGSRARMAAALQRCSRTTRLTPCLWGIAAWQARARGDWASARLLIDDGLTLCQELSAVWPLDGLLALSVELAALQGEAERLERHGTALRELGLRAADRRRLAVLDRASGLAALAAGALDAAEASLARAADVPFLGRGLRDAVLPSRVDLVEVLGRLDRTDEARRRAEALHPLLQAMDEPLAHAWDSRVRALVSEGEEADPHYEAAVRAHADAPDRFEEGRTELLYGEHLRRTRRRALARGHLARAESLLEGMRATPWLDRARQELRVAGSPRGPAGAWQRALTAQEATIAEAVSTGRSTREVAELLVLSPRTVETHLSSVYRKLGVTGRAGLAHALAARPE